MPIKINDLECKRFGIVAAQLTNHNVALKDVDQAAIEMAVDMLTTRVNVCDLHRVHALEDAGYRLMDTLAYFKRSLDVLPDCVRHRTSSLRRGSALDKPSIVSIAQAAFSNYIGHYHADPLLDNAAADAAYVEWAETLANSESSNHPIIVSHSDGELTGFLALRRNSPEEFEVVLNAVHPNAQRGGIYTTLIEEALEVAQDSGADRIIVSTQVNNYTVQRAWARLGFNHFKSLYTFHKWFTK